MRRRVLLLAAAASVAALVLVAQGALAGTPNGAGLYGEHLSHCWGAFVYGTAADPLPVTLVPGAGNSFWVAGHHLVIQSVDVTPTGETTSTVTFGAKTGQTGEMVTCEGDFPGYHVVSHDVLVP